MLGGERSVGSVRDHQLETEALAILELQAAPVAARRDVLRRQPLGPEVQRLLGRDAEYGRVDHAVARTATRRSRILEEGDVRPGRAVLVGVEQVVDRRVV